MENIASFKAAIENNVVETKVQEWAAASFRMDNGKPCFKGSWTIEQHVSFYVAKFETVKSEMAANIVALPKASKQNWNSLYANGKAPVYINDLAGRD